MLPTQGQVQSSDEHLAVQAQLGDQLAWEELIHRHYARLHRYMSAQTRDVEAAAELTQETFLTAFSLIHRYADDRPFAGWLYRIGQNHLHRWWRKQRLRRIISLEMMGKSPQTNEALWLSNLDTQMADRDLVEKVIDELSPSLRDVLLLHALGGLSGPEVAATLGLSLAATERRMSRAKAQFRERYNALLP